MENETYQELVDGGEYDGYTGRSKETFQNRKHQEIYDIAYEIGKEKREAREIYNERV